MPRVYNYKLWNPNLSQFVAQPDMRTADEISGMGGIIIPERCSIPGFADKAEPFWAEAATPARTTAA